MVGPITVSAKEIDQYIEQNKESIPEDADMKLIRSQIENQLKQEKTTTKSQEFIASLEKKAKIVRLKTF